MMRAGGENVDGLRLRGLIVVLWRAGLRISEALALAESDLDPGAGAILVRRGKGGKRREVGLDRWAWEQLAPWLSSEPPCRSAPCSASCGDRPAGASARQRASVCSYATPPRRLASGEGSPPTNFGTPTPSKCRAKASPRSHPTPARTRPPRHHLGVPARHRQHRRHPRRPRATHADDPGHQRTGGEALTATVTGAWSTAHLRGAPPSQRSCLPSADRAGKASARGRSRGNPLVEQAVASHGNGFGETSRPRRRISIRRSASG